MSDALEIFRAARAQAPAQVPIAATGYQVGTVGGERDLHGLAMQPGTPGYNSRIPKPPCVACGEDHFPNRTYDHEWIGEMVHDEPVSATVRRVTPTVVEVASGSQFRVALYVGRGDTYVVSVESAPDWDADHSYKVEPREVLLLISLARALGVKVADKTGGDLLMLEEEDRARQHAQNNGRGAASAGGGGSRRPGYSPDGPAEGQSPGIESASAELSE